MNNNNTAWKCNICEGGCGEAINRFGSLLCIYEYLTHVPGSDTKMWFKQHSSGRRELISVGGKVIAIWSTEKGHWRERTDKDFAEDWEEYGNETGDVFIHDEGDAFNLALSIH
ncbi:hypothetical protein [Pantoea sp. EKM20T]|uniref:hypothetical protein n=1 Tax=Pantoea sp. EKM20T TaxID=2708059 RepID=UPI001FAD15CF|nr:hypothetical protein [Pantoea sp. EKM20T]